MKVLIIYCHPSEQSYTYEILQKLKSSLKKAEIAFEVSDLYAMNFQSDMNLDEYQREGYANLNLALPNDVKKEHHKIQNADCIIFLYPVWWSDCPAKLKGWFDRVFSVGFAYGYDDNNNGDVMKTLKLGLAICTAGYANEYLDKMGIAERMRKIMMEDRLGERFENKEMIILGGTLDKQKVRYSHYEIIEKIEEKINSYCS